MQLNLKPENNVTLNEKIKKLPSCPGVYLMKDSLYNIIYVGKSKNLKNRVSSYFANSKSHSSKVLKLVKNLKDFDYIITDTEFEAFMLECKLIKEIKPRYNSLMKTPNSYCYIKIKINDNYPDIEICYEANDNDNNLYYGPYTSQNIVERGIQGIKECCKILCTRNFRKTSSCLNYSLGLCIGMCFDDLRKKEYIAIFDKIVTLLNGTDRSIIDQIRSLIDAAALKFDFETAAKYRDYLNAVNYLINKVELLEYTKENSNIVLLEYLNIDNSVKFFLIKRNKILFMKKYLLANTSLEKLVNILKCKILFFFNNTSKSSIKVTRDELDEIQIIYSYIKNNTNNCKHLLISEDFIARQDDKNFNTALEELIISIKNNT